ncbi:MAG TPA: aminoacyl--tRNA ligase-related protein, partial [Ktedonobacterales bacterium]
PATLEGSAHLPAHAGEMYALPADGLYLSPTAEAQLVGMVEGRLMSERELPLAYAAATPCYRREAGSAGAAMRGLLRQHQFEKVELVRVARSEDAEAELARILADAEGPLRALGLHYRVVALCAGELPFAAECAYDIEVWLPGEARFVEISTVSLCGEFQARRLNARYKPAGGRATRHPVTLNASALPIGRTIAALLEAGQQLDGTVELPPALASRVGAPALSPR